MVSLTAQIRRAVAQRRKEKRIAKRARNRGADEVARIHLARARWWGVKASKLRALRKERKREFPEWQPWMCNGRPTNISAAAKREMAIAVVHFGLFVTSTTGGGHARLSFHYPYNNPFDRRVGRAFNSAGSWAKMSRYSSYMWYQARGRLAEGFGPPNNRFVKHGRLYNGMIPNHFNHNHTAVPR